MDIAKEKQGLKYGISIKSSLPVCEGVESSKDTSCEGYLIPFSSNVLLNTIQCGAAGKESGKLIGSSNKR